LSRNGEVDIPDEINKTIGNSINAFSVISALACEVMACAIDGSGVAVFSPLGWSFLGRPILAPTCASRLTEIGTHLELLAVTGSVQSIGRTAHQVRHLKKSEAPAVPPPMRLASSRAQPFLTALNNQSSALARNGLKRRRSDLVSCLRNSMHFVAIKMGRRQGARSGAYLNRYVTDEQRGRRPIFIATLWAGASWLFFRVALSARMIRYGHFVRALKNSQLTPGKIHVISETGH
jgi:hypothetical protein